MEERIVALENTFFVQQPQLLDDFALLLYPFAMTAMDNAVLQVHKTIQANRPKNVPIAEFLKTVIDSFPAEPSTDSAEEEAKARVLARGVLARKRLEQAEGGSLSSEEVAHLLGLNKRQSVDYHRREKALVAWRTSAGKWRYPRWQFSKHGILPGVKECLRALAADNEWGAMIFFLSPRYSLDGRRPLDLLREGKVEEVVAAAHRHHHHGSF